MCLGIGSATHLSIPRCLAVFRSKLARNLAVAPRCHAEIAQCSRRALEIATAPAHGSRAPQTLATGRASEIAQAPPGAP